MQIPEKSEYRADVLPLLVCQRAVHERKIATENKSVGIKNVYGVVHAEYFIMILLSLS